MGCDGSKNEDKVRDIPENGEYKRLEGDWHKMMQAHTGTRLYRALRAMVEILRATERPRVTVSKGVFREACGEQWKGLEKTQGRCKAGRRDRQQCRRGRGVHESGGAGVARREQMGHLEYSLSIKLCL